MSGRLEVAQTKVETFNGVETPWEGETIEVEVQLRQSIIKKLASYVDNEVHRRPNHVLNKVQNWGQ